MRERHVRCIICHTDFGVPSVWKPVDDPHYRQPALDELATSKVMFDIFFVGPDELIGEEIQNREWMFQSP